MEKLISAQLNNYIIQIIYLTIVQNVTIEEYDL